MISNSPQQVIVVGNGYLPYLTALLIQKKFKHNTPELLIVDLGKRSQNELLQSLGSMKLFHSDLGLSEADFVKSTYAEINLGFDYSGFPGLNGSELFCDAQYGFDLQNRRFSYLFNKLSKLHPKEKLEGYCLSAQLARTGRFTPPSPNPRSVYASINYGYRLTEEAYAGFLKAQLSTFNTKVMLSEVESVNLGDDGFIESIDVHGARKLKGDLFIDTSESQILKRAISDGSSLRPLFPPDLSVEVTHSASAQMEQQPTSAITAHPGMLQLNGNHRDQSYQTAISVGENTPNTERARHFIDTVPWIKNCVAMGCAFTNRASILIDNSHINQSMLLRLLDLWPRSATMTQEAHLYNSKTLAEASHTADLDRLHLALVFHRPDILSDDMRYKLDTFRQSGKVAYYEKELLQESQWPVLFHTLGIRPDVIDLSVQHCTDQWLTQELFRIKSTLAKAVEAVPLYQDFIRSVHN